MVLISISFESNVEINGEKTSPLGTTEVSENKEMTKYFTEDERLVMKDAIEDHRASLEYEPRSIYGKIVSSADRTIDLDTSIIRAYHFVKKNFPIYDFVSCVEDSYHYIFKKYGESGYAKSYVVDEEYEVFQQEIRKILEDKVAFVKKYMEVNHINDIKEYAKYFAIQAYQGQIRKSESDKPKIIHPLAVGRILEQFGCDASVISAGYLHDVVEDTKYELDDVSREFGDVIASLVEGAMELDKSFSWKERKQETIDKTRMLPLRKKMVVCADKINNLEDLYLTFEKKGKRDFSVFKEGEELQYWYYKNVYESLIEGEDEQLPLFKRLKQAIEKVFHKKEDKEFRDIIFAQDRDYYVKLRQLHAMKEEIKRLKEDVATKEEIEDACRMASVHDFIKTLPNGYKTQVGSLGNNLSAGEKQRIGLARAFLRGSKLILLDEPTSNVDSINEGIILKALIEQKSKKSIILVSHRESTMAIADYVYIMEDGKLREGNV